MFAAAFLAVLAAGPAHAGDVGLSDLGGWVQAAGVRSEAAERIAAWSPRTTPAFRERFPGWVQSRIARNARNRALGAAQGCADSGSVGFVPPGTIGTSEDDRAFEQSTFWVETVHCLDRGDAASAMAVYNSRDFRESVMPGLESFDRRGDQVCLETGAVRGIVDRTDICLSARELAGDGVRALHTRLVRSADGDDVQGVYYRESVVAFVDRDEGGVAVYRMVFTRGKDMGPVQRGILKKVAAGSQAKIADALEQRL